MGSAAAPLAALEVAIGCARATLAGCKDVRVHAKAHTASGLSPFEAGSFEDGVETFLFCLAFNRLGTRNHHGAHRGGDVVAADDGGGGAEIFDSGVGTGAQEDGVDLDFLHRHTGLEVHVLKGAFKGPALSFVPCVFDGRNPRLNGCDHAGGSAPSDTWCQHGCVDIQFAVVGSARIGRERAPVGECLLPRSILGRETTTPEVGERGLVRSNHTGACTGLDTHVADGHATFHGEGADS